MENIILPVGYTIREDGFLFWVNHKNSRSYVGHIAKSAITQSWLCEVISEFEKRRSHLWIGYPKSANYSHNGVSVWLLPEEPVPMGIKIEILKKRIGGGAFWMEFEGSDQSTSLVVVLSVDEDAEEAVFRVFGEMEEFRVKVSKIFLVEEFVI